MTEHNMADLNDPLVQVSMHIDDGCDWTAWLIWLMNSKRRMRDGVTESPPARPQVAAVKIEPKKKPRRRLNRSNSND